MKDWIKEHLVPVNACDSTIQKAEQYDSEQDAWYNWKTGNEMLWLLTRSSYDRNGKRIL